jgi:hypothetical protein
MVTLLNSFMGRHVYILVNAYPLYKVWPESSRFFFGIVYAEYYPIILYYQHIFFLQSTLNRETPGKSVTPTKF